MGPIGRLHKHAPDDKVVVTTRFGLGMGLAFAFVGGWQFGMMFVKSLPSMIKWFDSLGFGW